MDVFPYEILEKITYFISYKDILNLRLTCRDFYDNVFMKQIQQDKSRCLLMMVRNEKVDILIPFLDSALPYISYWVICDVNSTDNNVTHDLVLNYFKSVKIRGEFHQMGQYKGDKTVTEMMKLAKNKAEYILLLEDYYPIVSNEITKRLTLDGYKYIYHHGNIKIAKMILYKSSLNWIFSGGNLYYPEIENERSIGLLEDNINL